MSRPEDAENFVAYDIPPDSVPEEATSLDKDPLIHILAHIKDVRFGRIDFRNLKVCRFSRGFLVFGAEWYGELMFYGVEIGGIETKPVCKISVMFAGPRRKG